MAIRPSGSRGVALFSKRNVLAHSARQRRWPTRLPTAVIAAALSFGSFAPHRAEAGAAAPATVIEEFPLDQGGDMILVPVTVSRRPCLFWLDTGSSYTIYDRSLGDPIAGSAGSATLRDGEGVPVSAPVVWAPDAFVGSLRLPRRGLVLDLAHLRQAGGYDIRGIVGMDFLGQYVVRLDFDACKLQILTAPGSGSGREIPIMRANDGRPFVRAEVPETTEWFLIDTGAVGIGHAGNLRSGLLDHLLSARHAVSVAGTRHATLASAGRGVSRAALDALTVGPFHHQNLVFGSTEGTSTLGNDYWSRYVVTFDFPQERMFLKESRNFAKPVLLNKSGLYLLKVDGAVVVDYVDRHSPGARAGVRRGDVIIGVGTLDAQRAALRSVRLALCAASGPLPLTIERSGTKITVMLRRPF